MARILVLVACLVIPAAALAQQAAVPPTGRYQLVSVPGQPPGAFLVDTATGCVWQLVHQQETNRYTFVEVDVENLHWSWGSGAQQALAARVDASNLPAEQKWVLKQDLQRTGCGLGNIALTPGRPPAPAAAPPGTPGATPPSPSREPSREQK